MNKEAYIFLLEEAVKINFSVSFKSDLLKKDRKRLLSCDAPKKFGWIAFECGTILIEPTIERFKFTEYKNKFKFEKDKKRFYLFDDEFLNEVSFEKFFLKLEEWKQNV